MRRALVIALLVAAWGDDTSGDQLGFVAADKMSSAYLDAVCTYEARCGLYPDKATCLVAQHPMTVALDPNVLAAIGEGRIAYNGNNVDACFEAIATQTCDLTDLEGRVVTPACRHFTRGLVGAGNSCYRDEECISADCEGGDTAVSCQLGICVGDMAPTIEPAPYNHPCNPINGCVSTTYCDTQQNLCLRLEVEGMACAMSSECAFGLGCAGATCKPLPVRGEPCPDQLCRDVGTRCDLAAATPVCVAIGLPGDACELDGDCAPSYRCDPATRACVPLPALGQSCAFIGRCFDVGTFCDATGTCASLRADGQPCATAGECASGICDGMCRAPTICTPPA